SLLRPPPRPTLFPYTTLFRSEQLRFSEAEVDGYLRERRGLATLQPEDIRRLHRSTEGWVAALWLASVTLENREEPGRFIAGFSGDRKSTRLNSSHVKISYAVF